MLGRKRRLDVFQKKEGRGLVEKQETCHAWRWTGPSIAKKVPCLMASQTERPNTALYHMLTAPRQTQTRVSHAAKSALPPNFKEGISEGSTLERVLATNSMLPPRAVYALCRGPSVPLSPTVALWNWQIVILSLQMRKPRLRALGKIACCHTCYTVRSHVKNEHNSFHSLHSLLLCYIIRIRTVFRECLLVLVNFY